MLDNGEAVKLVKPPALVAKHTDPPVAVTHSAEGGTLKEADAESEKGTAALVTVTVTV